MTLAEFWVAVAMCRVETPDWRLGQCAFNALRQFRPELAEQIRGTFADPFYSDSTEDVRYLAFANFVGKNW